MNARLRRRLKLSDISQSRMRRYVAAMKRRPPVSLQGSAPRTVAVVVPCFRHAAFLPQTIESIVAQTRRPDEVIFVDDRSPDATGEILRSFLADNPWPVGKVQVLTNARNIGQAASLNRAIGAASSELIVVLNDDDYLMHDAVAVLLAIFARHPEVALIGSTNVSFAGNEALASSPKLSRDHVAADLPLHVQQPEEVPGYRHPNDLNMTHTGSCYYRLVWEAVGGYWEQKRRVVPFSDRDFQLRVNAIYPVGVLDAVPLSFWRNDSSVDRLINS
jgi:glycosyltransferase involved in cell wall biosynthesis